MAKRKAKKLDINQIDASDHPDDGGILKPGPGRESFKLATFWKGEVEAADQATAGWVRRGNKIIKRYRDERAKVDEDGVRRMNLLWSNIKVMKPAIYSKCPTPIVDRKFLDRDPTGRLSSQMLERSITNELPNNFHSAMTSAVYDRLLPGRGVIWARYEPEIGFGPSIPGANPNALEDALELIGEETGDENLTSESSEEQELETTDEQVLSEKVITDYIDWRDFYTFPVKARTWEEVQAIGKRVYISKKEAKERFGEDIGGAMRPDTNSISSTDAKQPFSDTAVFQDINERSIVVFEIWNKSDRRVYWISSGYMYLCDVKDDPLKLVEFFPVPKPLSSTLTNDTLIPVPDYTEYQDQCIQIDKLTQRIALLTDACKVAGVYNATHNAISRLFNETVENQLIPVDQWAMFAEAGGLKGMIDFVPLEQIQSAITTLQTVRQQCMIDLDQVTGLSDIVRGTSDSRETLGGIRLKNNNAGTRLSESQEDVARFARDAINIVAQIVSKHFSDETIINSSGILFEQELQPDAVIREWQAEQALKPKPPAPMPMGPAPQMAPPAGGIFPAPVGQPPQGMPPVVPPNGQQPMPPMGAPPVQEEPTPDPEILIYQKINKAIALIRQDVTRAYRISIETDSTIFGDKVQERQDASEFVGVVSGYLKQLESASQTMPEVMPLAAKMLQWAVRKYRTGRDLESEVDSFCMQMEAKAKDAKNNPPPNPEEQKHQMEMAQLKAQMEMEAQNDQREQERQAQNDQRDHQKNLMEDRREMEKANLEASLEKEKMSMEMEFKRREHEMRMRELELNHQHAQHAHNQKMEELKTKSAEDEKKRAEAKRKAAQPKKKAS